jgi:hypothetical protein
VGQDRNTSHVPGARTLAFGMTPPPLSILLIMLFSSCQFFFQVIRYSQHTTHVITTHAHVWAYIISIQVAMEVVEEAQQVAVEQAAWCISGLFYLVSADIPQSKSDVHNYCGQVLHHPQ